MTIDPTRRHCFEGREDDVSSCKHDDKPYSDAIHRMLTAAEIVSEINGLCDLVATGAITHEQFFAATEVVTGRRQGGHPALADLIRLVGHGAMPPTVLTTYLDAERA